jgi:diadenosine tetraphosphatase ApaH/serine/threonine PP2A family protein phosphatase
MTGEEFTLNMNDMERKLDSKLDEFSSQVTEGKTMADATSVAEELVKDIVEATIADSDFEEKKKKSVWPHGGPRDGDVVDYPELRGIVEAKVTGVITADATRRNPLGIFLGIGPGKSDAKIAHSIFEKHINDFGLTEDKVPETIKLRGNKIVFIGNVHANQYALHTVLEGIRSATSIENTFFCGNVFGYGLFMDRCITFLRNHTSGKGVIGAYDWAIFDDSFRTSYEFSTNEKKILEWQAPLSNEKDWIENKKKNLVLVGEDFYIVNSDLTAPEKFLEIRRDDRLLLANAKIMEEHGKRICFIAHDHDPWIKWISPSGDITHRDLTREFPVPPTGRTIVNVGSVGLPKDGNNKACFVMWDKTANIIRPIRADYIEDIKELEVSQEGAPPITLQKLDVLKYLFDKAVKDKGFDSDAAEEIKQILENGS